MKFYDSRRAPNPRRVRWFMAEKGIEDVEIVDIDIFGGQHKTPDYLAKAGLPNVPALEIDETTTITESVAICRYLESVSRAEPVRPRPAGSRRHRDVDTPRRDAAVDAADDGGAPWPSGAGGHRDPGPRDRRDQSQGRRAGAEGVRSPPGESEFIAADRVTIADILAVTGIDFARMVRFRPDAELVNVGRWLKAMMERPAAKAGV
jgi:glutathione S-transferase